MNISIATTTYDLDGHININALASSGLGETTRRTAKQKTLDGGVAVHNGGFSEGDRNMVVRWKTRDAAYETNADRIVKTYGQIYVSLAMGCFLAVPGAYRSSGGISEMSLSIISRVNQ